MKSITYILLLRLKSYLPYVFCFVVFFSDVGGATLDSHHGFVVEYGKDRDLDLGTET